MSGLPATFAELQPCVLHQHFRKLVASSEQASRALFSRMGASHSMGTAALPGKPALPAYPAHPAQCVRLPCTAPPTPAGPENPRLGP